MSGQPERVQPGDLITSELMNRMLSRIDSLETAAIKLGVLGANTRTIVALGAGFEGNAGIWLDGAPLFASAPTRGVNLVIFSPTLATKFTRSYDTHADVAASAALAGDLATKSTDNDIIVAVTVDSYLSQLGADAKAALAAVGGAALGQATAGTRAGAAFIGIVPTTRSGVAYNYVTSVMPADSAGFGSAQLTAPPFVWGVYSLTMQRFLLAGGAQNFVAVVQPKEKETKETKENKENKENKETKESKEKEAKELIKEKDTKELVKDKELTKEITKEKDLEKVSDTKAADAKLSDGKTVIEDIKVTDTKQVEIKSSDAKISDGKSVVEDAKVTDTKQVEIKSSDAKVSDGKSVVEDAKVTDTKQAEIKSGDAKVSDAKASDAKLSDAKSSEIKVSDAKNSEVKLSDAKAGEVKVSDAKNSEAKLSDAKLREFKASDAKLIDAKGAEAPAPMMSEQPLAQPPEAGSGEAFIQPQERPEVGGSTVKQPGAEKRVRRPRKPQ